MIEPDDQIVEKAYLARRHYVFNRHDEPNEVLLSTVGWDDLRVTAGQDAAVARARHELFGMRVLVDPALEPGEIRVRRVVVDGPDA